MAAKVNLRTGKIIGADKGSFAWYHEKGHLIYDDSEQGISNGVRQNMAIYCSLMFLALGKWFTLFSILALGTIIYLIGLVIYEELWCNNFAKNQLMINRMKGGKKTRNKNGI